MIFFCIILINCFSYSLFAVELHIHKSVTEIRQNYTGNSTYTYLFKNDEYENLIDDSINWNGTPFIKQELYNTIDSQKDALVTVKQSTIQPVHSMATVSWTGRICDCKLIQAKIIDPHTMLLENLDTGTFFYADKYLIEYKHKRPSYGSTTLTFHFGDTNYIGTLSYLIKGITWLPNYDLFITNSESCNLRGYAVIRNNQQQEYQVDNTCLFSGDLQLVNSYSSVLLRTSAHNVIRGDNSTSKSIQFTGEEKGFYFYSLKTPYILRPLSSIRLPFMNIIPQCQFYYKAIVNIHNGQFKGVFQRYYDLISNQFLPAGLLTIRDDQVLIGQSNLPDIPQNYTQTITIGQDHDVRYSIKSNLTSSNAIQTKDNSRTYELDITISNYKNKEIKGQLEFHGSNRIILHETTCSSGKMDGNMFILSVQLEQGGIYQCHFNVTLK